MNKKQEEDQDKELENVALKEAKLKYPYQTHSFRAGASFGAEWQKEKSANDAIEFAEWFYSQEDLRYDYENKIWGYVTRDANGEFIDEKEYTSKEMYELWKSKQ
jgi:hypothetical protein